MANDSPHFSEGSVRRSARKRRSPGEWWKEFSTEEENAVAPSARSQQDISQSRKVRASQSSTLPNSRQCIFSDAPLQLPRTPRKGDKGACADSSPKRRLFCENASNTAGKAANKHDKEVTTSGTGKETTTIENQSDEWDVDIENIDLEQPDQSTSKRHHESSPQETETNPFTSQPSPPNSPGGLVYQPSCSIKDLVNFTDKSSLTTTTPGSFPASLQTNVDEAEPSHSRSGHQREERRFQFDTYGMEADGETTYDEEIRHERDLSDHLTLMHTDRSRVQMNENDSVGACEEDRITSVQVVTDTENVKTGLEVQTPEPSRGLFSEGPSDEFGRDHRVSSKLRAPRKGRSKQDSPSYSFSLRSRHGSPDFSASVQKLSRNRQTSGDLKRNKLRQMQQKALVAKRSTLVFNSIAAYVGTVKVAISISMNENTMGEVVLLPRSETGPRRASTGDEFYIVKQGYVECDVGFMSVTLFAGDHLGIPEGQSFEMRNPSASKSELFFFSPRSLLN